MQAAFRGSLTQNRKLAIFTGIFILNIFQDSSKDKFSPQCECTVLTDLSVDSIYIPNR